MEKIDRKFSIIAFHETKGTRYTENEAVLFLAKDKALPAILRFAREEYRKLGGDERQDIGIALLIGRVERYQAAHPELVKVPDVDPGKEESVVNRPNEVDVPKC